MFCHQCGNKLSSEAKFCHRCGKTTDVKNDVNNVADDNSSRKHTSVKGVSHKDIYIAIFIGALLICATYFIAVDPFHWQSQNKQTTVKTVATPTNSENIFNDLIQKHGFRVPIKIQSNYLKNGIFYASFPEEPQLVNLTQDFGFGNDKVPVYDYNYTSPDGVYELDASYVPGVFSGLNYSADLDLRLELDYSSNYGWTVISSDIGTYDGLPAIRYTSHKKDKSLYSVGMDVAMNNDLYMVSYMYSPGKENKQLESDFLGSVKFSSLKQASLTVTGQSVNTPTSVSTPKTNDLQSLVKKWRKSTAYIVCFWNYVNNPKPYRAMSGSALISMIGGDSAPVIITNKHVVTDESGFAPNECDIRFPDDNGFYYFSSHNPSPDGQGTLPSAGNISTDNDASLDIAIIHGIGNTWTPIGDLGQIPAISFSDRAKTGGYSCNKSLNTGDPILILGYPSYGTKMGSVRNSPAEPTATEGIISGRDGIYYTTSAKIEHGNSGGLALDVNNDCYLGIPTWNESGSFESLGRILPSSSFLHY